MVQARAAVLDVVDHAPLAAARYLAEPDRCRVVYSKIPGGPHLERRIMRHSANALFAFGLIYELAVITPRVRRVERAFQFLRELLVAHFETQSLNRLIRQR